MKYEKHKFVNGILILLIFLISTQPIYSNNWRLKFIRVRGIVQYNIEVAKDYRFTVNKRTYESTDNSYLLDLEPGIYYVRVQGVWDTRVGQFSSVYAVEIKQDPLPDRELRIYIPDQISEGEPVRLIRRKKLKKNLLDRPLVKWHAQLQIWIPYEYSDFIDYCDKTNKR